MNAPINIVMNKEALRDACKVEITADCNDNIITGLKQLFADFGEVNLALGIRMLAKYTEYTEDQIRSAIKRRGLDKAYFEQKLKNDINNANDSNRAADPVGINNEFRIMFDSATKANQRIIRAIMHNRDMTRNDLVVTFGGRSNNYTDLHKDICKFFEVKHVKYIPDSVMQSEAMQTWLREHPCPAPKSTTKPWNGLTDAALISKLKNVYGPKASLKGLVSEVKTKDGKSYANKRYELLTDEKGLAIIREYYLGMKKPHGKDYPKSPLLTTRFPVLSRLKGHPTLGYLVKYGYKEGLDPKFVDVHDLALVIDKITDAGLLDCENTWKRYIQEGLLPPVPLKNDKYDLWIYQNPKTLEEIVGINKDRVDQSLLATPCVAYNTKERRIAKFKQDNGTEKMLGHLYQFAKFCRDKGKDDLKLAFSYIDNMIRAGVDEVILSRMETIMATLLSTH